MKYQYLITTPDGDIYGTNDLDTANNAFDNEDCLVVDCITGVEFGHEKSVPEYPAPESDPDHNDDDSSDDDA